MGAFVAKANQSERRTARREPTSTEGRSRLKYDLRVGSAYLRQRPGCVRRGTSLMFGMWSFPSCGRPDHSNVLERSAGGPGIHPSAGRRPWRAAQKKTAPVSRAANSRRRNRHRGFIDSTTPVTSRSPRVVRCDGPRRVVATHLSRASPSDTRSRPRGAPLPRPAPWRAA
jgi:hypothetical protein